MSEEINQGRRCFLGTVAMTIAAMQFGMIDSAEAQSSKGTVPAIKPRTNRFFGSLSRSMPDS